jgi:serine/threonine-protein kinase
MELVGRTLTNRYEVVEKIGNGGMATVYKAKDNKLNRFVAIKVLKDEFAGDQEFIKRFQIEAQSAASLSQPNIVSIYDVANEGDIHFIVMELVEGKTLKDIIQKEGRLDWKKAAKIGSQIAAGLSTAHKNHIIHRDIKPHNIIITKEGIAKITDFGIAKAATSSTINAKSSSLGSVHYFSPEHARNGYTDEKSDIYSLGIVLYEMVTGKLPFDGDSAVVVAMKHLKEEPVQPKEIIPEIPTGLNNIIMKAMHKEVSGRYSSAVELYNDLQTIIKSPDSDSVGSNHESLYATQRVPHVNKGMATADDYTKKVVPLKTEKKNGVNMSKARKKVKRSGGIGSFLLKLLLLILFFALFVLGGKYLFDKMMEPTKTAVVPNVIGSSEEKARLVLENLGFVVEVAGYQDSVYPKGYVIKQKFESGEEISVGTKIGLTLSAGQEQVKIPDLTSLSVTAATKALRDVNLEIKVVEEENDDVEVGRVIRQDPKAEEMTYTGEIITVYVSKGLPEGMVYMPDLFAYGEEEAKEVLEALELVPIIKYTNLPDKEDGVLISQSINAKEKVKIKKEVTLVYNNLSGTTPVPSEEPDIVVVPTNTPVVTPKVTPVPAPTATPKPTPIPTIAPVADKYLTLSLVNKGSRDTFMVRVELNGDIKGRKVIYNKEHKRGDGQVQISYPGDATGIIRIYIDDALDSEMLISD